MTTRNDRQMALPDLAEPAAVHDAEMLGILRQHGFPVCDLPVELRGRYTKARRWTNEELNEAYSRWEQKETFNEISRALNRNPQDIIFKLLDVCKEKGVRFTEAGRSAGSKNWKPAVAACAEDLFRAGLPAWKIAVLFDVDFEHVEKQLFAGREDYGHKKLNPFAICTDHKRDLNIRILEEVGFTGDRVFEGYAGEGLSTKRYSDYLKPNVIDAVEADADTFDRLKHSSIAYPDVNPILGNARHELLRGVVDGVAKYDLIDLDPFVTCYDALGPALEMLNPGGLLFVTFGGEYRRCFIETNRKTIAKRYRAHLFGLDNKEVFAETPRYMLGELAEKAFTLGLLLEPLVLIRYPMVVRAYLRVNQPKSVSDLLAVFNSQVTRTGRGSRFESGIPKWKLISLDRPLADFEALAPDQDDHQPRKR